VSAEPIVQADDLVKSYRKGRTEIRPLDGLSLTVPEGECLALMGPSGSGKSTLLHILGGLDHADSGSCRVAGRLLDELSEKELCAFRAARIGFVFQTFNLVPVLTAAENIELPLRLLQLTAARRREQVAAALDIVGLADRGDHLPGELSGGEEQRIAIARAFATDPDLIIADEPTGDLDEATGDEIMEVLIALSAEHGKTVVVVTHDASKAARADRVLYFDRGRLSEIGPHRSVVKDSRA
jgi:putative ABC transport system ATP-binding protein